MDRERLPQERVVVRFEVRDGIRKRFWIVARREEAEVCVKPPGFDEDLVVTTDSEWLAKWQTGAIALGEAQHRGLIEVDGPWHLQRALAGWGGAPWVGGGGSGADVGLGVMAFRPRLAPGCCARGRKQ
jgi:hypothetical protein